MKWLALAAVTMAAASIGAYSFRLRPPQRVNSTKNEWRGSAATIFKDSGQLRETSFHDWNQGTTCRCVLRMTQRAWGLEVVHEPARRCHMRTVRP